MPRHRQPARPASAGSGVPRPRAGSRAWPASAASGTRPPSNALGARPPSEGRWTGAHGMPASSSGMPVRPGWRVVAWGPGVDEPSVGIGCHDVHPDVPRRRGSGGSPTTGGWGREVLAEHLEKRLEVRGVGHWRSCPVGRGDRRGHGTSAVRRCRRVDGSRGDGSGRCAPGTSGVGRSPEDDGVEDVPWPGGAHPPRGVGPDRSGIGVQPHGPARPLFDPVVSSAQADEVGSSGRARRPRSHVVEVAEPGGDRAAREPAPTVASTDQRGQPATGSVAPARAQSAPQQRARHGGTPPARRSRPVGVVASHRCRTRAPCAAPRGTT